IVRRAYMEGTSTIFGLCQSLKLPHRVVEQVFRSLRQQQILDVKGIMGEDYSFTLTNAGHRLAVNRRRISHYAGPAPVSIREYHKAVRAQMAKVKVSRESLMKALSDLVVTDRLLDQLGPALVSQKSLFLYGPTGNGKTSLAERLMRIYEDTVLIPYAVEVDGQIIVVYDPVVHERVGEPGSQNDGRWVVCKRPFIVTGGEMTPGMLELRLDTASQIYAAPLQMKANNGILVIDDFGRQVMSPRKLLNRWILPLDRRVDYLSLRYGVKFQIPFELMVVFSTNLDPSELADEAFLRRIHNKIYVEPVDATVFDAIFEQVTSTRAIPAEPDSALKLRKLCRQAGARELRACLPNDICTIIQWIKEYESEPVEIRYPDMERAVKLYFTRHTAPADDIFGTERIE
ncbi:MAG: AAA family ATPase, partial [Bryobacterales bacterium]|nr:AAA family ATPase [Bryobacterales bacterium]